MTNDGLSPLQWLEGDERMLVRIKDIFRRNVPLRVESLRGAIDAGDAAATEQLAHIIMGSSAMLGAAGMSDAARKIERSAIDGDLVAARLHFADFVLIFDAVMEKLALDGGEDEHPGCR